MSKLAKKVALLTGGSRGIGAAIRERVAADGASVAISYAKHAGAASNVVKAIERGGERPSRSRLGKHEDVQHQGLERPAS